jgi:MFS family permease
VKPPGEAARRVLYTTALLRAFSTGFLALVIASYLADRAFGIGEVSVVVAAGLAGNAAALAVTSAIGDRIHPRRALRVLTLLWIAGSGLLAVAPSLFSAAVAALVGMMNGMGRDRGAALALEQAYLPATTSDARRTQTFALYAAFRTGDMRSELSQRERRRSWRDVSRCPWKTRIVLSCSSMEPSGWLHSQPTGGSPPLGGARAQRPLSPGSRKVLLHICALFALDSLGGGFLTTALVSYFFFDRFGASEATIALLFFGARIANVASHFGAAALARRIGLVNTMVFTHVPSSLLLITVAFAPNLAVAAVLFLVREGLVEMDVPTRQSYVMALVRPEERGRASALTNLVRMSAWPVSALAGGFLMSRASMVAPLVAGALMKLAYDVCLYRAFRRTHRPEEVSRQPL